MTTETATRPIAPVLLACPWCGLPVETEAPAATLQCPACSVEVEFAPDEPSDRTRLRDAPPAGAGLLAA